jgi:hypothetical protein
MERAAAGKVQPEAWEPRVCACGDTMWRGTTAPRVQLFPPFNAVRRPNQRKQQLLQLTVRWSSCWS